MPTTQQASPVAAAYTVAMTQATQGLRERLTDFIAALWTSLGIYRNAQMADFTAQAAPAVEAAMAQMSSLTGSYLATLSQEAGHPGAPITAPSPTVQSVRGVSANEVYGRPFHQVWRDLHDGVSVDRAIESGLERATQTALTDLQLAKTHTTAAVIDKTKITARPYWMKRVLEGPESCALCIVASTQRYHPQQLLPIHPGCDCSTEPQWTPFPGLVLDEDLLAAAHDAIQQTFGVSDAGARNPDYRKLILVREHGELGPVLTVRGHRFTGPEAIKSGLDLTGIPSL